MKTPKTEEKFSKKESQERFEAALRGAMNTPHKALKDKPKVKKAKKSEEGQKEVCKENPSETK